MGFLDPIIFHHLDRKARALGNRFAAAAEDPRTTQETLLLSQIRREQGTGFGRDHHFHEIRSIEDFRANVPVTSYEDLEPYLTRVYRGDTSALLSDPNIRMFAMTSGTSAARKYIPVTQRFVEVHRLGWFLWALATYEGRQHLLFRDKFQLAGNEDESRSPRNVPCGSISGMTARMQVRMVRRTYCLPLDASRLEDAEAKYYLAWRIGLSGDVGSWITPNPSTHVNLARFGDNNKERLIRDVRDGVLSEAYDWPDAIRRAVRRKVRPNPERAKELDRIVNHTGHLYPKDVWPNFGLIGCWLGGPLRAYLQFFPEFFGDTPRHDLGLIASECRMTIPLHDETAAGVLDLFGSFFEFIPVGEEDSASPTVLLPHELQENRDYFILVTTASGLYRYNIHDVVRCVGWYGRSPLIEFQNKGRHFSNITGEKISEIQTARAVEMASVRLQIRPPAFALAPCFEDVPYYGLFIEPSDLSQPFAAELLPERVDRELRRINCEYDSKRASHRLGPIQLHPLPEGTWHEFDADRMRRTGATLEQYKRPCLFPDLDFAATIAGYGLRLQNAELVPPHSR